MQLKIGELARRTGLTVRTLHHYDDIGLLKPSGRSASGYRLYSRDEVARLHGIQALRHLGLALKDIAVLLAGKDASPNLIIEQQIRALDQEIDRAMELRGRLALMRDGMVLGAEPDLGDWLGTLALMTTYGKYFSASELELIFQNWKPLEAEWTALQADVRQVMDQGLATDASQVQPLATRWMALMLNWMDGDMELLQRWGTMYRRELPTHSHKGPEGAMVAFITEAVDRRMAALGKYLQFEEFRRFGRMALHEWRALEETVLTLIRNQVPPDSDRARAAAQAWSGLVDELVGNDPVIRGKLLAAWTNEPLLQSGSVLSEPVREYLARSNPKSA